MSFPWKETPTTPRPLTEKEVRDLTTAKPFPPKPRKPKITGADTLAYKYACTKRRWWADGKIGVKLKPENKEADKLLFEREVWPKYKEEK